MQEDGSFNPLITMYKMSFILINNWIFLQVAAPQLEGRGEIRLGGWTFECSVGGARRGAVIGAGHGGGPHRLLRERVQGGRKSGGRLAAGERAGQPAGARQITPSNRSGEGCKHTGSLSALISILFSAAQKPSGPCHVSHHVMVIECSFGKIIVFRLTKRIVCITENKRVVPGLSLSSFQ